MLALGGGSVLAAVTRERLRGHRVVHLKVGLADGIRRTGMSTARPLLAGVNPRATFKALLDARAPLYREVATVEIETSRRSPSQVVRAVLEAQVHRRRAARSAAAHDATPPDGTPAGDPAAPAAGAVRARPPPPARLPNPDPLRHRGARRADRSRPSGDTRRSSESRAIRPR